MSKSLLVLLSSETHDYSVVTYLSFPSEIILIVCTLLNTSFSNICFTKKKMNFFSWKEDEVKLIQQAAEISPEILSSSKATKEKDKHISFNMASTQ